MKHERIMAHALVLEPKGRNNTMSEISIKKRIPSDTTMDQKTFLNDKKIDGDLYGYLQSISVVYDKTSSDKDENTTVIYKNILPTQSKICELLKIKQSKTLRTHLKYLVDRGFLIESTLPGVVYELPNMERFYYLIPIKTLKYLTQTCQPHVLKIYTYLGTKFSLHQKTKPNESCMFTSEEIGAHIGINVKNHSEGYQIINNSLVLLNNSGLIEYKRYYDKSNIVRSKLISVNLNYKDASAVQASQSTSDTSSKLGNF